jgi:hypothetical protein
MMSLSLGIAAAGGTSPGLAHRVISLLRSSSIASGANGHQLQSPARAL